MSAWLPFALLGGFVAAAVIVLALSIWEERPQAKRMRALEYAAFLALRYPDMPIQAAAEERYIELGSAAYAITERNRDEMSRARLVIDGWHLVPSTE